MYCKYCGRSWEKLVCAKCGREYEACFGKYRDCKQYCSCRTGNELPWLDAGKEDRFLSYHTQAEVSITVRGKPIFIE